MKKTIFPLLVCLMIAGIILSSLYYQQQIAGIAENSAEPRNASTSSGDEEGEIADSTDFYSDGWLGSLLSSDYNQKHQIVFFGSNSLVSAQDGPGWPEIVMDETNNLIAPLTINHDVILIDNDTSTEELDDFWIKQIIEKEPTIIIAESLTLNDNSSAVTIQPQQSVDNLNTFFDQLTLELPSVEIILVPTNPIGKASFYPLQIATLNENAHSLAVDYFDHWDAWPEDIQARETYLENGRPNNAGQELWAGAFLEFFIDS
ncbi:SGNH/GDSL hydrolase family protein [Bacillus sp. JCM 19041]|uniref:SGNH/GDSL hydrolase family protein n=1 Tax=Bacillus sp. JCM 19041 TaxID=1460637 RepID=UPI000A59BB1F